MIYVFYFFAGILVLISFKSLYDGLIYLRFFKSEIAKPVSAYTPFVTLFAPCRGLDPGLEKNLLALLEQDHPEYEVIFIVDDAADPAVEVICGLLNRGDAETQRGKNTLQAFSEASSEQNGLVLVSASQRLSGEKNVQAKLVVAPKAEGCSQKVENLREAVLHVADSSQVFAFVDSDVRPSPDWLRSLIAPLERESTGAATAYRWFISPGQSFGSELRSTWNASIASALGPNTKTNFCWGGSFALRRDTFERIGMRDKWAGTLSDDFAVTRALNDAGLPIVFVPKALTASVEDCTFSEMLEFTTRQMKITRVYAAHLWLLSMFGSVLFNMVMIAAIVIAIFTSGNDIAVLAAVLTIFLVLMSGTGKAGLRLMAVRLVLSTHAPALKQQLLSQDTLWVLTPAVFFYNAFAALISRRMTWRGTTYELISPTETVIITR